MPDSRTSAIITQKFQFSEIACLSDVSLLANLWIQSFGNERELDFISFIKMVIELTVPFFSPHRHIGHNRRKHIVSM